jgi:hypothetical protein
MPKTARITEYQDFNLQTPQALRGRTVRIFANAASDLIARAAKIEAVAQQHVLQGIGRGRPCILPGGRCAICHLPLNGVCRRSAANKISP